MKNFIQEGRQVTLTAPVGGVVAGTAYKINALVVVAHESADEGAKFIGYHVGVFSLPVGSDTPAVGAKAYFKSNNTITTTASGNTLVGAFTSTKDSADNAEVLFTGQVV